VRLKEKMEQKFKYIDIVFENCICIKFLPEDIRFLYIGGISKYIQGNGTYYTEGYESECVKLSLYNSAFLRKSDPFVYLDETDSLKYHLDNYHDITHINICDLGNNEKYIGVPWKGGEENEFTNPWEKVEYNNDYFTVTIEKSKVV
jgi:hypothetical protein